MEYEPDMDRTLKTDRAFFRHRPWDVLVSLVGSPGRYFAHQSEIIVQPLAIQHPILVVDHGDHGVIRMQINATKLHFGLLNGAVERCIPTLDPGRPLIWAARRPFNDYQLLPRKSAFTSIPD